MQPDVQCFSFEKNLLRDCGNVASKRKYINITVGVLKISCYVFAAPISCYQNEIREWIYIWQDGGPTTFVYFSLTINTSLFYVDVEKQLV